MRYCRPTGRPAFLQLMMTLSQSLKLLLRLEMMMVMMMTLVTKIMMKVMRGFFVCWLAVFIVNVDDILRGEIKKSYAY